MSSILSTLGLRATPGVQTPNHVTSFILANWFFAYGVLSTRVQKNLYKIDNNVAPREDLSKYGEAAVKEGKIDRRTLNKLKRLEAASANSIEGFTFFVAAILSAWFAGVPNETINTIGVWYTASRVAFGISYGLIESNPLSYLRSVFWWSGNISCFTALILASKRLN